MSPPAGPDCSPEWREQVQRVRDGSEGDFASTQQLSLEDYREHALERVRELIDQKQARVRMKEGQFASFMVEGQFKNYFEGGETTGVDNEELRRTVESKALGVPEDARGQNRPIYGYLQGSVEDHNELNAHGPVVVILDSDVMERAKIVFGDTIGSTKEGEDAVFAPDDPLQPTLLCSFAYRDPLDATALAEAVDPDFGFAELHIYGGVRDEDIVFVAFCDGKVPDEKTVAGLDSADIRYGLMKGFPS